MRDQEFEILRRQVLESDKFEKEEECMEAIRCRGYTIEQVEAEIEERNKRLPGTLVTREQAEELPEGVKHTFHQTGLQTSDGKDLFRAVPVRKHKEVIIAMPVSEDRPWWGRRAASRSVEKVATRMGRNRGESERNEHLSKVITDLEALDEYNKISNMSPGELRDYVQQRRAEN